MKYKGALKLVYKILKHPSGTGAAICAVLLVIASDFGEFFKWLWSWFR